MFMYDAVSISMLRRYFDRNIFPIATNETKIFETS